MLKIIKSVACFLMMVAFAISAIAVVEIPIEIGSQGYVLADENGVIIAAKNADMLYDMAGVTKLASALAMFEKISAEKYDTSQAVAISKQAASVGGMSAFLASNKEYDTATLLKCMLMISANDATVALAEKLFGSQEACVIATNASMGKLNISPTLINATGHKAQGQGMSLEQAAIISGALIKYPNVLQYTGTYMDNITHADGRSTELVNPNRLVRTYSGCDGLATGSNASGYSGVFTATRNNQRYIVAIAGAKDNKQRLDDAQKLLDYGFANFKSVTVVEQGKGIFKDVPVEGGDEKTVHGIAQSGVTLIVSPGDDIKKEPILFAPSLKAPVTKGDVIGELHISKNGEIVAKIPVIACVDIQKASILNKLKLVSSNWVA